MVFLDILLCGYIRVLVTYCAVDSAYIIVHIFTEMQ